MRGTDWYIVSVFAMGIAIMVGIGCSLPMPAAPNPLVTFRNMNDVHMFCCNGPYPPQPPFFEQDGSIVFSYEEGPDMVVLSPNPVMAEIHFPVSDPQEGQFATSDAQRNLVFEWAKEQCLHQQPSVSLGFVEFCLAIGIEGPRDPCLVGAEKNRPQDVLGADAGKHRRAYLEVFDCSWHAGRNPRDPPAPEKKP